MEVYSRETLAYMYKEGYLRSTVAALYVKGKTWKIVDPPAIHNYETILKSYI